MCVCVCARARIQSNKFDNLISKDIKKDFRIGTLSHIILLFTDLLTEYKICYQYSFNKFTTMMYPQQHIFMRMICKAITHSDPVSVVVTQILNLIFLINHP